MRRNGVEQILNDVNECETVDDCGTLLSNLSNVHAESFEEFAHDASHAIANAELAVKEKRRQLVQQAEVVQYGEAPAENARRVKAASDLKAACCNSLARVAEPLSVRI